MGTAIDPIACSDRVLEKLWDSRSDKGLHPQFVGASISRDAADGPSTAGEGGGESRFSTSPVTPRTPELTIKPEASPTLKEAVSELTEPFKMALPSLRNTSACWRITAFVHSKKSLTGKLRTILLSGVTTTSERMLK